MPEQHSPFIVQALPVTPQSPVEPLLPVVVALWTLELPDVVPPGVPLEEVPAAAAAVTPVAPEDKSPAAPEDDVAGALAPGGEKHAEVRRGRATRARCPRAAAGVMDFRSAPGLLVRTLS